MTERCDLTELLTTDCAHCRKHQSIEEEVNRERGRLLLDGGFWFPAQYAGKCWACSAWFEPKAAIRRTRPEELLHETEPGYIAECCADEQPGGRP